MTDVSFASADEPSATPPKARLSATGSRPGEFQQPILVVEDDSDVMLALTDVLEDEGYCVFTARNGVEALNALTDVPKPCLILLDLMMPEMGGVEFLDQLHVRDDGAQFPVIVLSALPAPERVVEGKGVIGVLRKPFAMGAFAAQLEGQLAAWSYKPYSIEASVHVWNQLHELSKEIVQQIWVELEVRAREASAAARKKALADLHAFAAVFTVGSLRLTFEVSHTRRTVSLVGLANLQ